MDGAVSRKMGIIRVKALLYRMGIEDPRKHPTEAKLKWDGMLSDD
jgi:hypothetical protein